MYSFKSVLFAALAATSSVSALGINCRGSSECDFSGVHLSDILSTMQATFNDPNTDASLVYNSGDQFACAELLINGGGICAFFQSGASGSLGDAISFVEDIQAHNCGTCGSVPTQPGNDVSTGQVTINFTSNPCCATAEGNDVCTCVPGQTINSVDPTDPGESESPLGGGDGKRSLRFARGLNA